MRGKRPRISATLVNVTPSVRLREKPDKHESWKRTVNHCNQVKARYVGNLMHLILLSLCLAFCGIHVKMRNGKKRFGRLNVENAFLMYIIWFKVKERKQI